jgi:hypothetical protein
MWWHSSLIVVVSVVFIIDEIGHTLLGPFFLHCMQATGFGFDNLSYLLMCLLTNLLGYLIFLVVA